MIVPTRLRNGTAAAWVAANPVLGLAEMAWESDTNKLKIGDGVTPWVTLAYFAGGGGGTEPPVEPLVITLIDGGNPLSHVAFVPYNVNLDGGSPSLAEGDIIDGGSYANNGASTTPYDGGTYTATDGVISDGGTPTTRGTDVGVLDGGTP